MLCAVALIMSQGSIALSAGGCYSTFIACNRELPALIRPYPDATLAAVGCLTPDTLRKMKANM